MPAEIIANAVASSVGSLALMLNPTPEFAPIENGTNAVPAAVAEAPAEHLFGEWGGLRSKASNHGYDFTVQYIAEVLGNVTGGVAQGTVYNGLLNVAVDVNFEKACGWQGGAFHAAMLYPQGRSLTDNYVHDLFVLSNLDASNQVRLFEIWLEQNFAAGRFSIRVGQMAVDQEFAFTEQGALFNNSAFGWFPIVGAVAPVYPQGAPGVRLKWQPSEKYYFQIAATDGDVNPADANGLDTNPHGTKLEFNEGAFIIAEAGQRWECGTRPGSLKLGGWYHTAAYDDVRIDNTGLSLANPLSTGIPRADQGNWGFYVGGEQIVWQEDSAQKDSVQGLGVFSRLGYAVPDRNTFGFYAEAGVTRTGWIPGRDDDVCGLGIAYGKISRDLHALGEDYNFYNSTSDPLPDFEMAIELEYQWKVRPGFSVQPGLQYIVHPGGSAAIPNALVLGLRAAFDF